MQITTCPVCGREIHWEPALDGEPKCGRCGWEPEPEQDEDSEGEDGEGDE